MSRQAGRHSGVQPAAEALHRPRVGLVAVMAVAACLVGPLLALHRDDRPLSAIARQAMVTALPAWHTTEPVSEIVYGTRGVDTFGETFLLLGAVVSVQLLTRGREGRSGFVGESFAGEEEQRREDPDEDLLRAERLAREAEDDEWDVGASRDRPTPDDEPLGSPAQEAAETMSVVVRAATRAMLPVLAVAGCYLVAQGYSPGGGFPAGGVIAGVALLAYAALGYRRVSKAVSGLLVEVLELLGALALVAIEALGLVLVGSFSANWIRLEPQETLRSGGVMQAFNVTEFVEVGAGLTIALFALMTMRHDWSPDPDVEDES